MLTAKEQAMVARTVEQAKGMDKSKCIKIVTMITQSSAMLCIEPGVYTTPEGKVAVIAAIQGAIASK